MSGTQTNNEVQPGAENTEVKPTNEVAAGQQSEGGQDDVSLFSDPKKAEEAIKALRAENAKHRTKNKTLEAKLGDMESTLGKLKKVFGGEDENVKPEEKAAQLAAQNEALQVELGISQLALEHGIGSQDSKYFKFLLAQKFEELEEGAELTEEDIQSIVSDVRQVSMKKAASTGLDPQKPDAEAPNSLTPEAFGKMTLSERSQLYAKNPEMYSKLFKEAIDKKLL